MFKRIVASLVLAVTLTGAISAETFEKVDTLRVKVYFREGNMVVDRSYRDNSFQMDSFKWALGRLKSNNECRIISATIVGASSPSGGYQRNKVIAGNRATSFAKIVSPWLEGTGIKPVKQVEAIDWEALAEAVEISEVPYKAEVLDILHNTPVWVVKNGVSSPARKLALQSLHGGASYRYMERYLFGQCRSAVAKIAYEVTSPKAKDSKASRQRTKRTKKAAAATSSTGQERGTGDTQTKPSQTQTRADGVKTRVGDPEDRHTYTASSPKRDEGKDTDKSGASQKGSTVAKESTGKTDTGTTSVATKSSTTSTKTNQGTSAASKTDKEVYTKTKSAANDTKDTGTSSDKIAKGGKEASTKDKTDKEDKGVAAAKTKSTKTGTEKTSTKGTREKEQTKIAKAGKDTTTEERPVKAKKKTAEPEPEMGTYPVYDDEYEYREKAPFCMSFKTNLLYDAILVPNIGAEFHVGKNWTVGASWMGSWWNSDKNNFCERIYGGEIDVRKYFGRRNEKPLTGHHVGIYGMIGTYDVNINRKNSVGHPGMAVGYQSKLKHDGKLDWSTLSGGVGIEYGYSLPVARRLNIDFSIGLGYFGGKYTAYYLDENHARMFLYNGESKYFGPTKAEVSLVWLIGNSNYNKTKRGR